MILLKIYIYENDLASFKIELEKQGNLSEDDISSIVQVVYTSNITQEEKTIYLNEINMYFNKTEPYVEFLVLKDSLDSAAGGFGGNLDLLSEVCLFPISYSIKKVYISEFLNLVLGESVLITKYQEEINQIIQLRKENN